MAMMTAYVRGFLHHSNCKATIRCPRRSLTVTRYRSKRVSSGTDELISTSEDAWERWEFGNETFIDKALEEQKSSGGDMLGAEAPSPMTSFPTQHPANIPLNADGEVAYEEGLALLRPFVSEERNAKMMDVLAQRSARVRFVLEDPINPSNAWACLRTLDSFGVQYVDVITNPGNYVGRDLNPRFQRMNTAMGTQKWLDLHAHQDTVLAVAALKRDGWAILGTDLSEGSVPLTDLDLESLGPFAIVMGNEDRGISPEMRALCDHKVYLPMRGFAQSFSLSVGCASIASHLNAIGGLKPGSLPPQERDRILFKWYLESVKGARQILRRGGLAIPKDNPPAVSILDYKAK